MVFFVIYLFAGSISYDYPDFQDHSKAAERIASGSLLYRDHISYFNFYHYPPVFLYTLGGVYYLVGVNFLIAKSFLAVFNILAAVLLYIIARDALGERAASFSLILFLVNPLTFSAVYIGYFDNFVVFFMLLSIYFLLQNRPLPGGIALAVAFMSKPFPLLLLFVLVPYYLKQQRQSFLLKFVLAFLLTAILISAPFLILAPKEFLRYAFFYNFERYPDSLSFYFYFLQGQATSPLPMLFQALFTGWFSLGIFKSQDRGTSFLLRSALFLFLGFFTLNRINYPHYLINIVPFFSFILVEQYELKNRVSSFLIWKHLLMAFSVILLGGLIWAYPWSQGIDFKSSIYSWIGSAIYFIGCFYLLSMLYLTMRR